MPTRADMIAALSRPLAELPDPLPIPTLERPFDVTLHPPGSKSIANRALVLAALAHGESTLTNVPAGADDVRHMIDGLRALGAEISVTPGPHDDPRFPLINATATVRGVGGRWKIPAGQTVRINAGAAGTTARFLTAAALLAPPGTAMEIDGDARLRERAMGPVIEAVIDLGARCSFGGVPGALPVTVTPPDVLHSPPKLIVRADLSSQFVSAMLLVAPFIPNGLHLSVTGPPGSSDPDQQPDGTVLVRSARGSMFLDSSLFDLSRYDGLSGTYIRLTLEQLERAGVQAQGDLIDGLRINPLAVRAFSASIAGDAASVGYFASAAAMTPGAVVRLPGITRESDVESQPEGEYLSLLALDWKLECETHGNTLTYTGAPATVDQHFGFAYMVGCPDSAPAAAAISCFAFADGGPGWNELDGLASLRHKECDRISALQAELARIGINAQCDPEFDPNQLRITPPPSGIDCSPSAPPITFETYNDHRMAMSLALIGLRRPNVSIRNPACVAKSYPTFWRDLARLYH